jgi:cytochrome c553
MAASALIPSGVMFESGATLAAFFRVDEAVKMNPFGRPLGLSPVDLNSHCKMMSCGGQGCQIKSQYPHLIQPFAVIRVTATILAMKLFASFASVAALSLSLLCATSAAAAEAAPAKPDLVKGAALYSQVCIACHAADGNSMSPANPKLAQQHPEYLVKQLQEFKSGKRANAIMSGFSSMLSDDDMRNVSYWLASQTGKPGAATEKELVVLGESIYRGGIAGRNVPACAGCHSPNGAGIPSQYPRLSGQHADYTATQLSMFRNGSRANNSVMIGVASRMNDLEIKAVSDYIAGLR